VCTRARSGQDIKTSAAGRGTTCSTQLSARDLQTLTVR
jgi:hypothetical protein